MRNIMDATAITKLVVPCPSVIADKLIELLKRPYISDGILITMLFIMPKASPTLLALKKIHEKQISENVMPARINFSSVLCDLSPSDDTTRFLSG